VYYNLVKSWASQDQDFRFVDAHEKTYSVRDDSDWDKTLKPRLRERLSYSKNIVVFLSSDTKNSRALREEVDYGVNILGLPLLIVYPEKKSTSEIFANNSFQSSIVKLWDNLPILRDSMDTVPRLHMALSKDNLKRALTLADFMLQTKTSAKAFYL
jgi:hypothetical protein